MAETKVYSIKIQGVDTAVNSIDDLERGVKNLETQLKGEKIGTDAFKRLQNEVKKAKGQLKDFELQVEGLDKEQRATALVDSFNGLTGAVGAVSSAFIAFGGASENIENAEKKLLGVIGVVSGLRDASNGLVATQKLLGNTSVKLGDALKTSFKGGVKGANALKGALIATGIGALVVAVGLLIQYWDEFIDVLGLSASAGQENLKIAEAQTAEAQSQLDATNASTDLLKQQGMMDREILQLKIKQTDEVITALEAQLVAQAQIKEEQIATAQRNKDILAGILRFITAPLEILLRTIDGIGSAFGQDFGLAKGLLDANEALAGTIFSGDTTELDEGVKETEKQLLALKNSRAGYQNSITAIDTKAGEDRQKTIDDANQKELDALAQLEASKRALREATTKEERDKLKVQLDNKLADLNLAMMKELEVENLTEEAKKAIRDKYRNEELIATEGYNDAVDALNEEAKQKAEEDDREIAEREMATQQMKYDLASQGINAVNGLLDTFKTEDEKRNKAIFNAQKAFSISQAIIDTYGAVSGIFKNASINPTSILFPAQPYIQAGIALASGLANVRKISQTQYGATTTKGGSSFGGGGGAGGSNQGVPATNTFGAPNLGGDITSGNSNTSGQGNRQQPIKAYVLAGDVVSSVDADRKINQRRTL